MLTKPHLWLAPLLAAILMASCTFFTDHAQRIDDLRSQKQFSLQFQNHTGKPPYAAKIAVRYEIDGMVTLKTQDGTTRELGGKGSLSLNLGDWYSDSFLVEVTAHDSAGSMTVEVFFQVL